MARVADRADIWEKVIRKLHGRMMPPQGRPRPDEATIDAFAASLETSIDRVTLKEPNPGRSPLHRLNRSEYAAAVRDVLALDIDATALLPADDEANGFDNIADVLKVSPSLLEQYLTAARKVSALAIGDPRITPVGTVHRVPPDRSQEDHIEGLPLGTRGGALVHQNFPSTPSTNSTSSSCRTSSATWPRVAARTRDQHRRRACSGRGRWTAGQQAVGHEPRADEGNARPAAVDSSPSRPVRIRLASRSCARTRRCRTSRCSRSPATSTCRT